MLVAFKSAAAGVPACELTAPIVFKDEARRIVYGPVLIPDEPDTDGDVVTAEKIEEVAHKFLKDYGTIDVQHTLNYVGRPVESYVAPQDLTFETPDGSVVIPKGSWVLGVFVEERSTWDRVQRGELTGYSIMAVSRAKALKELSPPKRVTLRDLGEGWVAVAVSLVDRPAVPAAKWVAIKSAAPAPGQDLTTFQRTFAALLGIPVAGKERPSEKTLGLLRSAYNAIGELLDDGQARRSNKASQEGADEVNKDELQAAVKAAVDEAVAPLKQRLDAVEKAAVEKPAGNDPSHKGQDPKATGAEPDTAVKELLTQIDNRLQQVEKELNPGSRQPDGQDPVVQPGGTVTKSQAPAPTRDAFGRRLRS